MSFFDDIIGATPTGGGKYFYPGRFVVKIRGVKFHESTNPQRDGIVYFIVETEIMKVLAVGKGRISVGDIVTWRPPKNDPKQPSAVGNIKSFCIAAGQTLFENFQEGHVDAAFLEKLTGGQQALVGKLMEADAFEIEKKNGDPFTLVQFSPTEWTEEKIAAEAEATE